MPVLSYGHGCAPTGSQAMESDCFCICRRHLRGDPAYETESDSSSCLSHSRRAHLGHGLRRAGRLRRHDRHVHLQRRALCHRRARAAGADRGARRRAQGRRAAHGGGKTRCTQTALARRLLLRHGAGHRLELPAGRHRRRNGRRKGGLPHGAVRGARAGVRPVF